MYFYRERSLNCSVLKPVFVFQMLQEVRRRARRQLLLFDTLIYYNNAACSNRDKTPSTL